MSDIETKYEVVPIKKSEIDLLIVRKKYRKDNLYSLDVSAYNTYDKPFTILYADHLDDAFEQIDELIGKLQAIRQDLDITTKE